MNQRLERINNLIRDEIAAMLRRDIHDPLIGFVTITGVEVSPDLRHAKVFFSVLGDAAQVKESIKGLLRARKFINSRLAERVELRYIPRLRFVLDETAVKAQRLQEVLSHEHEELAEALQRHEAEDEAAAAEAPPPAAEEEDELDRLVPDLPEDDEDWSEEPDEEWDEDEDFQEEEDDEDAAQDQNDDGAGKR